MFHFFREGHSACVLEDRYMIVIGGWNSDTETIYDEIWIFDSKNKNWCRVTQISGNLISERES